MHQASRPELSPVKPEFYANNFLILQAAHTIRRESTTEENAEVLSR